MNLTAANCSAPGAVVFFDVDPGSENVYLKILKVFVMFVTAAFPVILALVSVTYSYFSATPTTKLSAISSACNG